MVAHQATPPKPDAITFRVPGAVDYTGISRSKIYELIAQGEIRARKCGGATLIERSELDRYIGSLPYADVAGSEDRRVLA